MNPSPDLATRLRALTPLQRTLLVRRLEAEPSGPVPAALPAHLTAYVAVDGTTAVSADDLRAFLGARMPEYMVPSAVVVLDQLPRTPNGKVDRRALAPPRSVVSSDVAPFTPPRTPAEVQLAAIWSEVLGVEPIGVEDNFFEIGGDSISSIQIISRANRAGLRLKPGQFFDHPTIAALARLADTEPAAPAPPPAVAGPVPLTPIQRWFFEQPLPDPSHWNQVLAIDVARAVDVEHLEAALHTAVRSHDAFRLRFRQDSEGWTQALAPPENDDGLAVAHYALSATPPASHEHAIEQIRAASQDVLDLSEGPLLHAALVDRGPSTPYRLILTAHHLVVDVLSWQTVLADVERACARLCQGEAPELRASGTPFGRWAEAVQRYGASADLQAEQAYWIDQLARPVVPLPTDGTGPNTERSAETLTTRLDPAETQALSEATATYGMKVPEIVLTALGQALADWVGSPRVRIDLEGHGRVDLDGLPDSAETVGWFTTLYPVTLEPAAFDGPREALIHVKELLRAVPNQGIGYGVLRYLAEAADRRLAAATADLLFNYMGHAHPRFANASPFREPVELLGSRGPGGTRAHLIEINTMIADGALTMRWTYSTALHHPATIERLARATHGAMQSLVGHCLAPEAGAYTPSDFPDVDLNQDDLDALLGDFE